ncbi:MAG TPA: periplasmic heavy metal sensor [Candidatus Polarisedimenticolaceae bacterium]|nr:periplasmic heavy metal sensor [Candidatus Polarisedimenticolaceae bacterium]
MKNALKGWTIGLAIAACALTPALAQGWGEGEGPHHRGPGPGPGPGFGLGPGFVEHLAEMLDLTSEQRSQVHEIVRKHMDGALGERLDAMREAHETLHATIHDAAASDAQVQQAAAAAASQLALVATEQHHLAVEVDAVLTAEQRERFAEMRQRHGEIERRGPPRR